MVDKRRSSPAQIAATRSSNYRSPCRGDANKLLDQLTPADFVHVTPEAQRRLFDLLTAMGLPQQPASAPLLVIYAGQDICVPRQATRRAIERACALGVTRSR
jgi:hypothetical protein